MDTTVRRFTQADEVQTFPKGTFELVNIGAMTLARATYEPGWIWSRDVAGAEGAVWCEGEHIGVVLEGKMVVKMRDGTEFRFGPGDLFYVPPGHDSWVAGDERYVSLHLMGAAEYAKMERERHAGTR